MSSPPAPDSSAVRWVGVTIELPEPYGSELTTWRERLGDPSAAKIPPHITLLPPTALDVDEVHAFSQHLTRVAAALEPFTVRLAGSSSFRPVSPVVFLALAEGAPGCTHVQAELRSGPIDRALPFAYHPHVTVAHDLPEPQLDAALRALAEYEAEFKVAGFSLFERDDEGYWHPGREFPFGS